MDAQDKAWSSAIEAILIAAERPVTIDRLREVFGDDGPSEATLQELLERLEEKYAEEDYGFDIRRAQGGFQFCTKVCNGDWVRKFLETKPFRLSRSALETLAIVAYRQPLTRAEIDKIRGIDSSHLMRTLIEKGIVKMMGKAEIPGRPVQYGTTDKFLDLVGLKSVNELPPLSELKELQGDQPEMDEASRVEQGLEKFIDASAVLEDRQKELEAGLTEIEDVIKSAGDPKREIYQSQEEAETAQENTDALQGFLAYSRGKRWPKVKKPGDEGSGQPSEQSESQEPESAANEEQVQAQETEAADPAEAQSEVPAQEEAISETESAPVDSEASPEVENETQSQDLAEVDEAGKRSVVQANLASTDSEPLESNASEPSADSAPAQEEPLSEMMAEESTRTPENSATN